ncbi:hypothetical protein INT46_006382 [Mucor plumbeus]|uniref:Amino acid transporter transmembrane domain-containing protein n=1 Tax=Mucor plumbeus TaxID=97098 RepID=A0A8H7V9J5_9FUNG|nr:hypothetical protein INT46_006382 [Mucor plumbeus]
MRSKSAPTRYNHDKNKQDVNVVELISIEQSMKLPPPPPPSPSPSPLPLPSPPSPPPPPPPLADNTIKYVEMESPLNEQEILEEQEDLKRNVSNTNTLSSIICVVAGTGILAIAHALSKSGWIGLLYLIASACMSHFTGIILIKCLYSEKCNGGGRLKDYADIGFAAFVCYLVFGDQVQSPVYKSLPIGSSQNVAMFVITAHVILVIPFYLYVFTARIESWLKIENANSSNLKRITVRIGQVIVCGIFAMFIPYFSDFMALVGSILSDTLSFVLPSIFWLKLNWYRNQKTDYEAIACFIVAMVGVFCATFGTIDAAKQLYHDYVIQQIRPELIKAASANTPKTSATRWVDIEAKKIAINQNPAIVFDSLLHKSASVTNKESHESFEDAIL